MTLSSVGIDNENMRVSFPRSSQVDLNGCAKWREAPSQVSKSFSAVYMYIRSGGVDTEFISPWKLYMLLPRDIKKECQLRTSLAHPNGL